MSDLVEFLRARLDDDERVAREAGSCDMAWSVNGTWYLEGVEHNVVGREEAFCHPHNVEHIARHDPARVLADVDAKRRRLAAIVALWANKDQMAYELAKLEALPYAEHPDYRDEWRP